MDCLLALQSLHLLAAHRPYCCLCRAPAVLAERSVLFQGLTEILFGYAQLLEDFMKKPASDIAIAMYWNSNCPAVGMLHLA